MQQWKLQVISEIEDLQLYYSQVIFKTGMKFFYNLSFRELRRMQKSWSYAVWKLNRRIEELKSEIYKQLNISIPPTFPEDRI